MTTATATAAAANAAPAAHHDVASADRWRTERLALMAREKALVRLSDEIAIARRALPWERVAKPYVFDAPEGQRALADLFGRHRQLIVQHFMFGPGWPQGCPSCSYMADHTDGMLPHLAARGVAFAAVSRAPIAELERFRARMGWAFRWVSSSANDFNRDFHVSFDAADRVDGQVEYNYGMTGFPNSEAPGISVFCKDEAGEVFHTYSTFGRGIEEFHHGYPWLDLTVLGRQEAWEEPQGRATPLGLQVGGPNLRLPDEYDDRPA